MDDESPPAVIVLNSYAGFYTSENGASAEIHLVLSSWPKNDVDLLNIQSLNTGEGTVSTTSINFAPANWNSPQTITVTSISPTGTALILKSIEPPTSAENEGYAFVPIGFTYWYLGLPYYEIMVYTNGFASFNRYSYEEYSYENAYLFLTGPIADQYINILSP